MTTYVVYIQVSGQWLPISRPFFSEGDAHEWAFDLDLSWAREVRRAEG
jgi:hypothetical protein